MIYILDNFWPILVATAVGWGFGALYYSLLGARWRMAAGVGDVSPSMASHIIVFGLEFWIACILAGAIILAPPEAGEWTMAIGSAFVIWIGFVAPTIAANNLYGRRPLRLTMMDAGHWLGVFVVQVVIMQAWGLAAPATG